MFSESFAKATFGFSNVLFFTFFTLNHISKIVRFASDVLFDLPCLTRGAERVGGSTGINVRTSEQHIITCKSNPVEKPERPILYKEVRR